MSDDHFWGCMHVVAGLFRRIVDAEQQSGARKMLSTLDTRVGSCLLSLFSVICIRMKSEAVIIHANGNETTS